MPPMHTPPHTHTETRNSVRAYCNEAGCLKSQEYNFHVEVIISFYLPLTQRAFTAYMMFVCVCFCFLLAWFIERKVSSVTLS